MRTIRTSVAVAFVALLARSAAAQDAVPTTDPADYRGAIYGSCTVLFAVVAVYLVVTHLRAARVSEEISAVERRLDELEKAT